MRVIGGEFRSRRLKSVPGLNVRPTPDRLRETLFNVLGAEIEDALFLDAYAGSGAVGIEALSRGAKRAIFIEASRHSVRILQENLHSLGIADRATVVHGRALKRMPDHFADIVFLDPPYSLEREYREGLEQLGQAPPKLVIAQHSSRLELSPQHGELMRSRVLRQGSNALSFYIPGTEKQESSVLAAESGTAGAEFGEA
jgi:16S rRNA (guanine966-N2)-methyltransferase